jgi:hypothetical protein
MMALVDHWTILQVVGFLCVFTFGFVMVRAHFSRRSAIDLTDLITEFAGGKRRITMSRFGAFVGLIVGTWLVIFAEVSHTLQDSWQGIASFMALCFGYRVGDSWLKNQRDADAASATVPDSTTTTTDTSVSSVQKQSAPPKPVPKGKR